MDLPFVLISKWKAISVFKKVQEEVQKRRPSALVLFPLFSRAGFTPEGSASHTAQPVGPFTEVKLGQLVVGYLNLLLITVSFHWS